MPFDTKIATCSYCGRRQALRLTARDGHELACGACGAPLHEMKWLHPRESRADAKPSPRKPALHGREPDRAPDERHPDRRRKKKKHKKRKGLFRDAMEEAFDLLEDIFD